MKSLTAFGAGWKASGAVADLMAIIETYEIACYEDRMEFTCPESPIIPRFIARRGEGDTFAMEAGPGQTVSANSLTAAGAIIARRIRNNRNARLAQGVN